MPLKINEKISVNINYDDSTNAPHIRFIKWHNKVHSIDKIGLHYTEYRGETLFHLFAVCNQDRYFLLAFNTKILTWRLEEIAEN